MLTAQGSHRRYWQQTQEAVASQTPKMQVDTRYLDVAKVKQKQQGYTRVPILGHATRLHTTYLQLSASWDQDENVLSRGVCREYLRIAAAGCVLCRQSVRPDTDSVGASHPQPMQSTSG